MGYWEKVNIGPEGNLSRKEEEEDDIIPAVAVLINIAEAVAMIAAVIKYFSFPFFSLLLLLLCLSWQRIKAEWWWRRSHSSCYIM